MTRRDHPPSRAFAYNAADRPTAGCHLVCPPIAAGGLKVMSRATSVRRRTGHALLTAAALGLVVTVATPRAQQTPPAAGAKPAAPQGGTQAPAGRGQKP